MSLEVEVVYPNVCIVTPTLNQAGFIRETIDSVLAQDYPYIEYVVVDGGSTDGTQEILKSYGNKLTWVGRPGNQASAINHGMKLGNGLIRSWLNSDDTLLPGAVSSAVKYFDFEAGVVFGNTLFVGPTGIPLYRSACHGNVYTQLYQLGSNPIPQPSAFIARDAWRDLDESLEYFMDWDLWLRTGPIVYVDELWSSYRLHSTSKTCVANYPVAELKYIYEKNFKGKPLPPFVYSRMADYHDANGEWAKAKFRRMQAWLRG